MGNIVINQDSLKTSREWKRHQVKEGSNVFRILPPFGKLEVHNNYPYKKWSIAWLVDPRSGKRRPFASPMSDGHDACPVNEYQMALRAFIDKRKAQLEAGGADRQQVKNELKDLYQVQFDIKVQHVYAYNACDKSGTVGILEIKSTAQKALKTKMAEYISLYGQDPTSLNGNEDDSGVWFNITKSGSGKDTTYGVDFNKERFKDDKGRLVSVEDRSPLPSNVVEGYDNLGYDLHTVYHRKSYDELREILLYNLQLISSDVPEAVLPGFEVESSASDAPFDVEEPVKAKTAGRTVNLNLGSDDDDDDVAPAKPATRRPVLADDDLEDIKNLADSVLED